MKSVFVVLLFVVVSIACPISMLQGGQVSDRLPNIVLIVADDLGYADLGATGATDLATPSIDSLARDGVSFTDAYSSAPVCLPSRMGLLTGRYQQKFGIQTLDGPKFIHKVGMPLSEVTLADRLKSMGYRCGIVGKWHLGEKEEYRPNQRGFDYFMGFLGGGMSYYATFPGELYRNAEQLVKPAYLTDVFGVEAVEFIERNKADPFFLYLSFNAVHTPMEATPEYLYRYRHIEEPGRRYYAAMTAAMDDNIGRVLAALKSNELEDNTLVIFISDNGGAPQNWSLNTPFRGWKYELYEGGIRSPMFVRWPAGGVKPGHVIKEPVIAVDVVPTVMAALEQHGDDDMIDGVDLLPLMRDNVRSLSRERLFWRYGPYMSAMREGKWKIIKNGVGENMDPVWELYNLESDPGERNDLARLKPKMVERLAISFESWDASLPSPLFVDQRLVDGKIWWRNRAEPRDE